LASFQKISFYFFTFLNGFFIWKKDCAGACRISKRGLPWQFRDLQPHTQKKEKKEGFLINKKTFKFTGRVDRKGIKTSVQDLARNIKISERTLYYSMAFTGIILKKESGIVFLIRFFLSISS